MLNRLTVVFENMAEWSIYILVFALPFSKSVAEIAIAVALISLVFKMISKKTISLDIRPADIVLLAYVAASLLSLINAAHSPYWGVSIRAFFSKTLKFAALFFIMRYIIDDRAKLTKLLFIASASAVLILTDGFVQYFFTHVDFLHKYPTFKYYFTHPEFLGFPTASFPFPNDYAAWILIFIFPFGLFALFNKGRSVKRLFSVLVFAALMYSLLLTKVRGAWLGVIASLGVLSVFKMRKIGIVLLALFLVGAVFINRAVISDILSFTSVNQRSDMWKTGWKIFLEHPVIGSGVNTFFVKYMYMRQDEWRGTRGSYAHNCYLQMASDIGLVGLALFLTFVVMIIAGAFLAAGKIPDQFYNPLIIGIGSGLVAFLVHSAVDTNLYSLNLSALFWLSAGLLPAITGIAQKKTL